MKVYPYYPKPVSNKITQYMTYIRKGRSWLDGLYARSYTMKMGRVKMPNLDLYLPNEPDLIHRELVSEAKYFPKSELLHEVLEPLLGDSIFTTNAEIWKKQRELLTPSFEMIRVSQVFDLMQDAAKDMSIRLSKLADGKYHNIDDEMTFVTADIIFRTILSEKLDEKKGKEVLDAFVTYQEESAKLGMQKIFKISKLLQLFRGDSKRKEAGETIRNALAEIIKPRYEAMERGKETEHKDILSSLLKVINKDTGKAFSFKEILDQIAMLFLAGHETTASSMTWTLYLLALYPQYQEEAYKEVMKICKDDEFTIDNTKQLTFVMNNFSEALRLYPPVSFFPRETSRDIVMRDKKIKKGSAIVVSPWLMHRNERYWNDPHMFDPHRFDNPKDIVKNTYFPFGMGPRICIGARFAMQEAPLLLATILREYSLELEPGFTPDIVGRLTTRSLNGMNIKLTKRKKD
jgi:cytochrome P450